MSTNDDAQTRQHTTEPATPAAGVAIFNPIGVLLLGRHRHDGRWATFGGAIEPGEDAQTAALREVHEEIGVALDGLELLGTFGGGTMYTVQYLDGSTEEYVVTMFCTILDRDLQFVPDCTEVTETGWFSASDISSAALAPDMQEIVPAAFEWFGRRTDRRGSR